MGTFTAKWRDAAADRASETLAGTLYARYYDLPPTRRPDPEPADAVRWGKRTADDFAALCRGARREARVSRRRARSRATARCWSRARSSPRTTSRCWSTRSTCATSCTTCAPELADRSFALAGAQAWRNRPPPARALSAVKNAAYAWRQARLLPEPLRHARPAGRGRPAAGRVAGSGPARTGGRRPRPRRGGRPLRRGGGVIDGRSRQAVPRLDGGPALAARRAVVFGVVVVLPADALAELPSIAPWSTAVFRLKSGDVMGTWTRTGWSRGGSRDAEARPSDSSGWIGAVARADRCGCRCRRGPTRVARRCGEQPVARGRRRVSDFSSAVRRSGIQHRDLAECTSGASPEYGWTTDDASSRRREGSARGPVLPGPPNGGLRLRRGGQLLAHARPTEPDGRRP